MAAKLRAAGADLVVALATPASATTCCSRASAGPTWSSAATTTTCGSIYDGAVGLVGERLAGRLRDRGRAHRRPRQEERQGAGGLAAAPTARSTPARWRPSPRGRELVQTYEERLSKELDIVDRHHRDRARQPACDRARPGGRDRQPDHRRDARGRGCRGRHHQWRRHPRQPEYPAGTKLTATRHPERAAVRQQDREAGAHGQRHPGGARERLLPGRRGGRPVPAGLGPHGALRPARPPAAAWSRCAIGGQPLDPAATYTLATNDYMARGGDDYTALKAGRSADRPGGRPAHRLAGDRVRGGARHRRGQGGGADRPPRLTAGRRRGRPGCRRPPGGRASPRRPCGPARPRLR